MEEPLTEDMLAELLDAPNPRRFIDKAAVGQRNLADYLNALLTQKGLKRAAVVHDAGINETFGYQIFTGARRASRDNLLKLAFAMGLTLRETNRLLQAGGANELYCKNRRDAIIIFAISHGYPLQKAEEELYRFGESTIS
uniref:XRE family transcriptional regulator n=1 Tax=Muribaculaceae bacterium Z82 TaxID=2304548 RepID=A0A7C9JRP8_9BACT